MKSKAIKLTAAQVKAVVAALNASRRSSSQGSEIDELCKAALKHLKPKP